MNHEHHLTPEIFQKINRPRNRRGFLKSSITGSVILAGGLLHSGTARAQQANLAATGATSETMSLPVLGQVIDFAAGVPQARDIRAAGYLGGVRYVSARRPGTETWMLGKPVTRKETIANAALGLATASVYQYGRAETADWLRGAAGALVHVPQAIQFHQAAGGPRNVPIYMAIDDNPTDSQYTQQVLPYLLACQTALQAQGYKLGVYANYPTIDKLVQAGVGKYFWQHDWGSKGKIHPASHIHQKGGVQTIISGVTVDINDVYRSDWGQWYPQSSSTH